VTGYAALAVGVLFAVAVYLLLSRNTQRVAMGFLLLSNAVNLLVITASGLRPGAVPPILRGAGLVDETFADPLPQAFLLTAIVIGLGAAAFLLGLAARAHSETGSDELSDEGRAP
jgi:multicomponent Na+:H+ antiporter subunit C